MGLCDLLYTIRRSLDIQYMSFY
eukprot:COSAG06_NODE_52581_length_305_cov_0.456311_1_plen_22_part_10